MHIQVKSLEPAGNLSNSHPHANNSILLTNQLTYTEQLNKKQVGHAFQINEREHSNSCLCNIYRTQSFLNHPYR